MMWIPGECPHINYVERGLSTHTQIDFVFQAYVDGGFTDNLPQHFDGTTITVSPFSGESDICPDDASETLFHFDMRNTSVQFTSQNLYRMSRAFFPPSQEVLFDMCRQGFKDALKYLHLHCKYKILDYPFAFMKLHFVMIVHYVVRKSHDSANIVAAWS